VFQAVGPAYQNTGPLMCWQSHLRNKSA